MFLNLLLAIVCATLAAAEKYGLGDLDTMGVKTKIRMYYDRSFLKHRGDNKHALAIQKVKELFHLTAPIMRKKSMGYIKGQEDTRRPVYIELDREPQFIDKNWRNCMDNQHEFRRKLEADFSCPNDVAFHALVTKYSGYGGIAAEFTACTGCNAVALNNIGSDFQKSAGQMAHEWGHVLGMDHPFTDVTIASEQKCTDFCVKKSNDYWFSPDGACYRSEYFADEEICRMFKKDSDGVICRDWMSYNLSHRNAKEWSDCSNIGYNNYYNKLTSSEQYGGKGLTQSRKDQCLPPSTGHFLKGNIMGQEFAAVGLCALWIYSSDNFQGDQYGWRRMSLVGEQKINLVPYGWNDKITSMKVTYGCYVEVYEHQGNGKSATLYEGEYLKSDLQALGMDDNTITRMSLYTAAGKWARRRTEDVLRRLGGPKGVGGEESIEVAFDPAGQDID